MATNNKHYIKRLFLAAVILLASLTGAGAQTFTFECFGGFLTAADANCDICNSTVSSRLFNGLLIRKNGTVTYWIDCPYIVKQQGQNLVFQEIIPSPQTVTIAIAGTGFSTIQGFKDSTACMCARQDSSWIGGGGGDPSVTNEGILGVSAGGANTSVITSNTSGAAGVTVSGSTTIQVTETTSSNGGTILLQADTSILATLNDLRPIIDTVKDYGRLRLYNGQAALVFVSQNGIQGIFKRVTGSFVDDGGITIVGTNKWRRVAEETSIVNVKWFGAVGDSVTNDNTAIQAAVAFCKDSTNATLYFPKGKYRYTSTISFYKPVNLAIKGDGMHNTYLFPVNVTGIRIRTDSTTTVTHPVYGIWEGRDLQINDLSIIRSGANNFNGKIQGIDLRGGFNKKLTNVRVEEFFGIGGTGQGSVGIRLWPTLATNDATQHTTLENVYVTQCDTGIVSRLQNTLVFYDVKIDANKDLGLMLSNPLYWNKGLCQGNENCGIWLNNSNPFVLNEVTITSVHFEGNAYVAPKWGGVYKNDNTDMTDLSIKNCLFSSPGNTHILRLRRVQHTEIVNNRYLGNATTDTISLTSFYDVRFGNDNYYTLKVLTSDAYITWLNGTAATNDEYVGFTVGAAAAGKNIGNFAGRVAIGATYVATLAPANSLIVEGDVGIGNTSPQRDFHNSGETRLGDLTTDPPTRIVGADADGDLGAITVSTGLALDGSGNLTATAVGTDLTFTGASSPVTLNSSTGTDVTFTAGTNVSLSQTGNNLTINSSAGGLTGSGANTQMAFWTSATNLSGSANNTWDGTTNAITGKQSLNFTGSYSTGQNFYNSTGTVTSTANSLSHNVFNISPTFANDGTLTGQAYAGMRFTQNTATPTAASTSHLFVGQNTNTSANVSQLIGMAARIDENSTSGNLTNRVGGRFDVFKTSSAFDSHTGTGILVSLAENSADGRWLNGYGLNLTATNAKTMYGGVLTLTNNRGTANTQYGLQIVQNASGSGVAVDNAFGIDLYHIESSSGSFTNYYAIRSTSTPAAATSYGLYFNAAGWRNYINGNFTVGSSNVNVRTLNVTGEARITDLVTDTPTKIVGADADGDLDTVGIGAEAELHLTNGTLGTNFHTTISPASLTAGMTNNWNPSGLATAWIIRMSGNDAFQIVTGITAPAFAKRLTIHNTGANAILFATENTSSTAGNRFAFGRDVIVFGGKSVEIIYDVTTSRWRLLSKAGIYDDVENQYFNTTFQAPVSLTTAEHDFWEISSTGAATAVTPTNGLLRGVSVNTGTSSTGCGDVASKEQFVSINTVDGAATWGYVKAKIVTPSSLSNGTNDYALRIGFLAGECGSDLVEGAYFYYNHAINSGAWSCYTQNAGSSQNNNSGITVAASTIYTLEVVYRPNISVEFFINGTRVATNDTNVPDSDAMKVVAEIEKQGGTAQRDLQVYLLQTSIAHVN